MKTVYRNRRAVNHLCTEGVKNPIGFFPLFYVPDDALWWGPASGILVASLGRILPAWGAYRVKVIDVFSSVA